MAFICFSVAIKGKTHVHLKNIKLQGDMHHLESRVWRASTSSFFFLQEEVPLQLYVF